MGGISAASMRCRPWGICSCSDFTDGEQPVHSELAGISDFEFLAEVVTFMMDLLPILRTLAGSKTHDRPPFRYRPGAS